MIDLSVIVLSYETADLLGACLDSLHKAGAAHPELRFEVIVIDNGSRDASAETALASDVAPRVVAGIRNRGFAAGVNTGLRQRRGRHVLLLNSDVEVDPALLVEGVRLLDTHPSVGVVGAELLHPSGARQRSVHPQPGLSTELLPEFLVRRFRPAGFATQGAAVSEAVLGVRDVEAVRGAVFFVQGALIEKVGGLDERYFFFLEETDYCARTQAAGYRVVHAPGLRAVHRLGASSKKRAPLATRIEYHRSLYRYLDRHRSPFSRRIVQSVRAVRNAVTVMLLSGPAVVWPPARSRVVERFGLLMWHLRGCPDEPTLGDTLGDRRSAKGSTGACA